MKTIYFIYANDCKQCQKMDKILSEKQFVAGTKQYEIEKVECEEENAVNFAIKHGLNDLPSCKIGDIIIEGEKFNVNHLNDTLSRFTK